MKFTPPADASSYAKGRDFTIHGSARTASFANSKDLGGETCSETRSRIYVVNFTGMQ
jgi:hypothetical protein